MKVDCDKIYVINIYINNSKIATKTTKQSVTDNKLTNKIEWNSKIYSIQKKTKKGESRINGSNRKQIARR